MKKIFSLTKNEIIKESSKVPFLIACAILVLFSVLTPIIYKNSYKEERFRYNVEGNATGYLGYTNFLNHLEYKNFEKTLTEEEKKSEEYLQFLQVKNEINKISEQYSNIEVLTSSNRNNFYRTLIEKQIRYYIYNLYLENENYKDNKMIYNYYKVYLENNAFEKEKTFFEDNLKKLLIEIEALNEIVIENDYNKYIEFMIKKTEDEIRQADKLNDEEVAEFSGEQYLKDTKETKKYMLKIYEELDDKDIKGYEKEYIINYLDEAENYATYALSPISENGYSSKYKDKEEYYKVVKQSQQRYLEEAEKLKYAVINEIDYLNPGIREALNNSISGIKYLSILVLVISCGMLTKEFDKGSIRLLLTKPNQRWKIILSKVLTIIFFSFVYTFTYMIISFITSIILYGTKDLSIQMIEYGTSPYTINYMLYILKSTLFNIPTLIFLGIFSLCISLIFRNTVFPMLLSLGLLFLSVILIGILDVGFGIFGKILFIPHINLYNLMTFPNIEQLELYTKMEFSPLRSFIALIIYSIIFVVITILVFNKKDIEN